jgi:hypothetical protein
MVGRGMAARDRLRRHRGRAAVRAVCRMPWLERVIIALFAALAVVALVTWIEHDIARSASAPRGNPGKAPNPIEWRGVEGHSRFDGIPAGAAELLKQLIG